MSPSLCSLLSCTSKHCFPTLTTVVTCTPALRLLVDVAQYKRPRNAAGVAYWEHDYLNGATNSDNLVRRKDSTFTDILLPAAKAVGRKIAALPAGNGCVPGQLSDVYSIVWFCFELCRRLLHGKPNNTCCIAQVL